MAQRYNTFILSFLGIILIIEVPSLYVQKIGLTFPQFQPTKTYQYVFKVIVLFADCFLQNKNYQSFSRMFLQEFFPFFWLVTCSLIYSCLEVFEQIDLGEVQIMQTPMLSLSSPFSVCLSLLPSPPHALEPQNLPLKWKWGDPRTLAQQRADGEEHNCYP